MTILHSVTLARAGSDVVAQALVDAELHSLSKCILFFDIDPAVMEALPSSALPAFRTKLCARLKEKREDFDEAALDGTSYVPRSSPFSPSRLSLFGRASPCALTRALPVVWCAGVSGTSTTSSGRCVPRTRP